MATGGDRDTDAAGDTAELLTFEVDSDRSSYYSDGSIYCPHISAIRHALHGDHLYDFYNSYSDDDDVPPLQTISSVEDEEPGYDYKFVCNVPGALVCLICTGVARNAQQVDCCGKIFCRVCLHKLKRSQNKVCPNCRQKRWRNFPDKKSNRDIEALIVKCSNEVHGCKWEGELGKIETHLKECTNGVLLCKYSSIGCNMKASSDDMSAHEKICAEEHLKMAVQKVNSIELLLTEIKSQLGTSAVLNLPPVVFKMTSFELHRSSSNAWSSPPFYTHSKGYKFYIRITIVSCSGGHFVSVKVCLCHGENDDNLVWPFAGIVHFSILNQTSDIHHLPGCAKFQERRESDKNRRVSAAEGKSTAGWGEPCLLHSHQSDFGNFVQKDCLYLMVNKVEISATNKPWLI